MDWPFDDPKNVAVFTSRRILAHEAFMRSMTTLLLVALTGCAARPARAPDPTGLDVRPLPSSETTAVPNAQPASSAPAATAAEPADTLRAPATAPAATPAPTVATFGPKAFTIDPAAERRLVSGLKIDLELFDGAQSIATCRLQYDLWDEVVVVKGASVDDRRKTTESAVRACLRDKPTRPVTVFIR